jgi:hypothetical protein
VQKCSGSSLSSKRSLVTEHLLRQFRISQKIRASRNPVLFVLGCIFGVLQLIIHRLLLLIINFRFTHAALMTHDKYSSMEVRS